jgi:hypothetical protein
MICGYGSHISPVWLFHLINSYLFLPVEWFQNAVSVLAQWWYAGRWLGFEPLGTFTT